MESSPILYGNSTNTYNKFVLKRFPGQQFPENVSCLEKVETIYNPDDVKENMIAIRIKYVSIDPMLRVWISGAKTYLPAIKPGSSIPGFGIGQVIKINKGSNISSQTAQQGDWVIGMFEWSEIMVCQIKQAQKIYFGIDQFMYRNLTIYGPTGLTSYLAIRQEILPFQIPKKIGKPGNKEKAELNILISSAAGGVGVYLIEFLVKLGYKNIYGIAGSEEKCRFVQSLGARGCINYKEHFKDQNHPAFAKKIVKMMGGQTDIYFDNIGQDMLTTALLCMRLFSKVILCGATATYNNWQSRVGIMNQQMLISKRIELKGILYYHYSKKQKIKAIKQVIQLNVKGSEVIIPGMDNLPITYRNLYNGKYLGKPIVEFAWH